MKPNPQHRGLTGIYCIRNLVNGKVYVGKAKCLYHRIREHVYLLKKHLPDENQYLQRAWDKYGKDAFEYVVLEYLALDETLVREREMYWMLSLDALNTKVGYNLRADSDSGMVTHPLTSAKISQRLKNEWAAGTRAKHGEKLAANWLETPERKAEQSVRFSKTLTKYMYRVDDSEQLYSYQQLKLRCSMGAVIGAFHRKKSDIVHSQGMKFERVRLKI